MGSLSNEKIILQEGVNTYLCEQMKVIQIALKLLHFIEYSPFKNIEAEFLGVYFCFKLAK